MRKQSNFKVTEIGGLSIFINILKFFRKINFSKKINFDGAWQSYPNLIESYQKFLTF